MVSVVSKYKFFVIIINYKFSGKYRIESLSGTTFESAKKVFSEAFCLKEKSCIGACVSGNILASSELDVMCAMAAVDAVSLVAVHVDSGDVAAVSFNKIQTPTPGDELPYFECFAKDYFKDPSSQSLARFMQYVDDKCNLFEKYNIDCLLEIMFLATLKQHRKRRLSKQLAETSLKIAEDLKNGPVTAFSLQDLPEEYQLLLATRTKETPKIPQICSAIFSSKISQKIGIALGFKKVIEVRYDEFKFDGKTYAERIGPEHPESWVKELYF